MGFKMNMVDISRLELINMKINRENRNTYAHEYILIDGDTYKRYKVSFKTSSAKVSFDVKTMRDFTYTPHDYHIEIVVKETNLKDFNGSLIEVEELD